MFITLYDLLKHCEKAIEIYNTIAENNGMDGDIESFQYHENRSKMLDKMVSTIRDQLETNKPLPISGYIIWLNEPENESVKEILLDALQVIKQDREYKIKKLNEEIEFSDLFLDKYKSESILSVGDKYDN